MKMKKKSRFDFHIRKQPHQMLANIKQVLRPILLNSIILEFTKFDVVNFMGQDSFTVSVCLSVQRNDNIVKFIV